MSRRQSAPGTKADAGFWGIRRKRTGKEMDPKFGGKHENSKKRLLRLPEDNRGPEERL